MNYLVKLEISKTLNNKGDGGRIGNWLGSNVPACNACTATIQPQALFNYRRVIWCLYGSASWPAREVPLPLF